MTLTIDNPVYEQMLQAARARAPIEACGLCGGRDGRVSRFIELTHADATAEHFRMLPAEQFAAVRSLRADGLRLLAVWHSHPATPARLSREDLRLAYTPDVVYLILSLAQPLQPDLKGFRVTAGEGVAVFLHFADDPDRKDNG